MNSDYSLANSSDISDVWPDIFNVVVIHAVSERTTVLVHRTLKDIFKRRYTDLLQGIFQSRGIYMDGDVPLDVNGHVVGLRSPGNRRGSVNADVVQTGKVFLIITDEESLQDARELENNINVMKSDDTVPVITRVVRSCSWGLEFDLVRACNEFCQEMADNADRLVPAKKAKRCPSKVQRLKRNIRKVFGI